MRKTGIPQDGIDTSILSSTQCALDLLGDTTGKIVLDCGCGSGISSAILARNSTVHAFDISEEKLRQAEFVAKQKGVERNIHFRQVDFYNMDYDDESFDLVFGAFIIHHLTDKEKAGREVCRVMQPGARAIFIETWEGNPVLRYLRPLVIKLSPSLRAWASPQEHPLAYRDVEDFCRSFSKYRILFPYFLFWHFGWDLVQIRTLRRIINIKLFLKFLDKSLDVIGYKLDALTYRCFPFLRKYSYFVVIEVIK